MNRRRFLASAALAGLAGAAGCTGERDDPIIPDGMTVETRHRVANVLATDFRERRTDDFPPVVLADADEARDRIDASAEVREFAQETDFDRSYLLVVQSTGSSEEWLELRLIERTDAGLGVEVVFDANTGAPPDVSAAHSLVIRVTDERMGLPDEVDVTVDSIVGGPSA